MAEQPFTSSLKAGVLLGKYEIREQVAAGGMAIIYKAYDAALDRYVAIKQIAPHLALDEKFAVRFRTEAQTLARLSGSQANIVHVHELLQQDGQLFLVMEYVEGTTLRVMMDKGPIPFQTGLGIMLSVALGLRAMHAQGIVHRDLTPNNIMMAKDGALKITDFGLIGHSGGRTSLPMGTTKYMAPEMFTGAPVDPRADLYSLGMIAYEMFAGPEKYAEAFRDVLRDEKAQQVRWMHWHSNLGVRAPPLKDVQPGIPPLISKVVERLMDKDPSRRFASADQVVKWLRKIFVMNVQAKSVTVDENEAIEKEMEADTAASPGAPGPARAGQTSAGVAGASASHRAPAAETGDKTAPLPKPAMTWQRAVFWAAVIFVPLALAAGGLIYWKYSDAQVRIDQARSASQIAKDLFDRREYAAAAQAYLGILEKYSDLTNMAIDADQHVLMARAEEALAKKDWERADKCANDAQAKEAPPAWQNEFRTRFQKQRDVEEKLNQTDAAEKAGDFEKAKTVITELMARYAADKTLSEKFGDRILQLQEKIELREYRSLVDQGKQQYVARDYAGARSFFDKARQKRETPEITELIQKVDVATRLTEKYTEAEKAAAAGKWSDAANAYAECLKLAPSEIYRTKMNNARAEALAADARTLKENNLLEDAKKKYTEVLGFNPQHAEALNFLKVQGQTENLARFTKAGDDAKAAEQWDAAINNYNNALALVDAKDDAARKALADKITECKLRSALGKAREALGQNDFAKARQYLDEAKAANDTQEVKDLGAQVDNREKYTQHLNIGKELLSQANYVKALAELQMAQKIENTPEVQNLITECQYRRNLAQGKILLNGKKYSEARGFFIIARRYNDSIEGQALQKQAEDMLKSQKTEPSGP
jgi:tRNA A-37 threonylcarbamoyl transferase component Bud32/tetratricopeptide (TPR) repeat protein